MTAEPWVSVDQIAEHLGVTRDSIYRWIESNRIDRLSPATTTRGLGYHYHLGRTQAVDAASLVGVFESVLTARSREVFVSMQFGTPAGDAAIGFNLRHWQQVRFDDPLDLKTKLVPSLEQHSRLGVSAP